jgi:DeoR family glycerol-3-phosphate regulon repressor
MPPSFTPNPRQAALLAALRQRGSMDLDEMVTHFDVTPQTLRRDLALMARAGLVARFHGGARVPVSTTENLAYRQRQHLNEAAKLRIARAVARDVPEGSSLFLNIGTTMEAVARELTHRRGLRIITNNLHVASILADHGGHEVIVVGGLVRSRDRGIVGEAAVDFIRPFRVDIGLIGISGIEPDGTLRDYDYREVKVARAILESSRQVWLAVDHSKFNRPAMVQLAELSEIDALFTDAVPPPPFRSLLNDAGVELIVADGTAANRADEHVAAHARGGR